MTESQAEHQFEVDISSRRQLNELQRLEQAHGEKVHEWVEEGMPREAMGSPEKMRAFRTRKGTSVPWNADASNDESVQRSTEAAADTTPAGETNVPDSVREVISASGHSLDGSVQRLMESEMGGSFGDVKVHTGPSAANACEDINARAFTVGNHVAFNHGEYDPGSPEGQHVIAHELAHVRQQTGGAVSMLSQGQVELEVDPDPQLEREAEETAHRVMQGGEVGIQRLNQGDRHVQRMLPSHGYSNQQRRDRWNRLFASVPQQPVTSQQMDAIRHQREHQQRRWQQLHDGAERSREQQRVAAQNQMQPPQPGQSRRNSDTLLEPERARTEQEQAARDSQIRLAEVRSMLFPHQPSGNRRDSVSSLTDRLDEVL